MRVQYRFFMLAIVFMTGQTLLAQNYDEDSVRYTPIPKKHIEQKKLPAVVFNDTIPNVRSIEYFFNVNAGTLLGCDDCESGKEVTFTSSTIHGITIGRKLRTGIGAGLDSYYTWQTLPLFANVSWDLLGTKNTHAVFLQGQYGWAHAWHSHQPMDYGLAEVNGGQMIAGQIGYRVRYHDLQLALSIGGKQQSVSAYFEFPTYYTGDDGILVEGTPNTSTIKRDLRRFMISLSVGWR